VAKPFLKTFLADQQGNIIGDFLGIWLMVATGLLFIVMFAPWVVVSRVQYSIADGLSEAAQAGNGYLFPNQAGKAETESQNIFNAQVAGDPSSCSQLSYSTPSRGGQYYGVTVTCTTNFMYYHQTHTFHAQTRISIYQGGGVA